MACVSHFVKLKNFGCAASPRLRKAIQVGQVQTGGHDDKMVNIDLSRDIKESQDFFGKMGKLQIFVPQVSDLFFLRDTRDAAISCKQYDSPTT